MSARTAVTLVLLAFLAPSLALGAPPAPNCDSSNPNYRPEQTVHVFVGGHPGGTHDGQGHGKHARQTTFDTSGCPTGDGDNESGVGAAQFPEYPQGTRCDAWNGHHGGIGAQTWVLTDTANLAVDYTAGTDGQQAGVDVSTSPCTGNGFITDSYDTDPFDCGSGLTGHFAAGFSTPATIMPNPNPHFGGFVDPDPWATVYGAIAQGGIRPDPNGGECQGVLDGSAWEFLVAGPSESGLVSNPPLADTGGCPVAGDGSSGAGGGGCGLHGGLGSPSAGASTPIQGTTIDP